MASPCVNRCELDDARNLCLGCARTIDEIGGWSSGSPEWRADVMAALPARLAALEDR
ncbi:DUF1289 domain-containing protein [Sphingomonas aliaeris]|uniref:DUF1289 domain-containing protein n=1 Tax=Sphingomonas aliaeris TaxID=2759526 RepID=A0A974NY15_9SPHN|nr:DUF1289 domain-containing protein [Sphingomonas aliaeris]